MKETKKLTQKVLSGVLTLALLITGISVLSAATVQAKSDGQIMYRLYNPNSGEHFYTASAAEKVSVTNAGWRYEGYA